MKRIPLLDHLKAVSIILIVYGHNDFETEFSTFLSTFRLPLFFIISGIVRKDKSNLSFPDLIKKLGTRLLVPYFSISFLLYLIWFFVGRYFGSGMEHNPWLNFLGIFYSQGGASFMDWGIPLWFLTALFCVSLIDWFVAKAGREIRTYLVMAIALAGFCINHLLNFNLPWSFDIAMVVYPFYFFGGLVSSYLLLWNGSKLLKIMVVLICLTIHVLLAGFNKDVAFYYGQFGILPLTYLNGLLGFCWMYVLLSFLPDIPVLLWLGRNTLPVLAFHLLAMSFIKAVLLCLEINLCSGIFYYWLYTISQILILFPVILMLNRFAPWLVGVAVQGHGSNRL